MSSEVTIFHLGFVMTAHSATRKLVGFWSKRIVITGPISLPDLLVDLVEMFQAVKVFLVVFKKINIFYLDVVWIFKERHGWIFIREAKNESGVWR